MPVLGGVGIRRRGKRWCGSHCCLDGLRPMLSVIFLEFCPRGAELGVQRRHFISFCIQNRMCKHICLIFRGHLLYGFKEAGICARN